MNRVGTITYQEYLNGPVWQQKRRAYKQGRCELCGSDYRLDLHHLHYKRCFGDERPEDLATLCRYCHKASHIDLASERKLKKPSRATMKMLRSLKEGRELKPSWAALFVRRRWIAEFGEQDVPSMSFFRNLVQPTRHLTKFGKFRYRIPKDLSLTFHLYRMERAVN